MTIVDRCPAGCPGDLVLYSEPDGDQRMGRLLTCYNQTVKLPGRRYERRPGRTDGLEPPMLEQSTLPFPAPETWRPIPGYEGLYEVSDLGRVRSLRHRGPGYDVLRRTPLILRSTLAGGGYPRVSLTNHRREQVHRLVLLAFVGPCPSGLEAGHLNGVRDDNRATNLRWVTRIENAHHRVLHGTALFGDRHPNRLHPERVRRGERVPSSKLTETAVREIREMSRMGVGERALAEGFGVSERLIGNIVHRRAWRHVVDQEDGR